MKALTTESRTLGLFGAVGVGVGAIVGGGILALAGVAFSTTGPGAILAFALNGVIALLTALSFAEMASKFPESGGTYAFSKKVLSVEAAFTVGWVVWFASVVAAVLYAVGFAYFGLVLVRDLWQVFIAPAPEWMIKPWMVKIVAVATTALLAVGLVLKSAGGGQWVNVVKVIVFGVLIVGGLWALVRRPPGESLASLQPFFSSGFGGLIQAMGYTFIALQGFDLIAAVAGDVREPSKNVPRAMILSLMIALLIYIPLLFVIATVGTPAGQKIDGLATRDAEGVVATAAQFFLGAFGYWLVVVAAVLSMFSALQANLFAASRIARAMARDRTLPARLSVLHGRWKTPAAAVVVTALLACSILLILPDVAAAGAAASLIFLVTFALAHWIAVLVRQRSVNNPPPFCAPWFPVVPIVGGLACLGLAVFQGISVPEAGIITLVWLFVGSVLFLALFARRARVSDAASLALEPELLTLRGRRPVVLVPIANPQNAKAMIELASALVPPHVGRVLAHTVITAPPNWDPNDDSTPLAQSQQIINELLRASASVGIGVETLTTIAPSPLPEIARIAQLYRCKSVLLGLSKISEDTEGAPVENLLSSLDTDVVVLRSGRNRSLASAKKILVPVAGRGGHEQLLVLLLGSLLRTGEREVTFLRVLPTGATPEALRRAHQDLTRLVGMRIHERCEIEICQSDDAVSAIAERADEADLLILGVQRVGKRKKLFASFTRQVAQRTECPLIVISRRG